MKRGKPLQRKASLARKAFKRERDLAANSEPERTPYISPGRPAHIDDLVLSSDQARPLIRQVERLARGERVVKQRLVGRRRTVSPASREQRLKTQEGCRVHGSGCPADPAHVIDRSLGGCNHEDCTVPLCRPFHRAYDEGEFDLLPYLSLAEQAHAASHVGLMRALRRITNYKWAEHLGPETRY